MQVKMDRRLGDPSTEKRAVETFPVPPLHKKSPLPLPPPSLCRRLPGRIVPAHRLPGRAFLCAQAISQLHRIENCLELLELITRPFNHTN